MQQTRIPNLATPSTWDRGVAYATEDRVRHVEVDPIAGTASGVCRGSGSNEYRASVTCTFRTDGSIATLGGYCECPVRRNCKHCVAVGLVGFGVAEWVSGPGLRPTRKMAVSQHQPVWKRQLASVFPVWERESTEGTRPLALQVELTVTSQTSRRRSGRFGVLRPTWTHEGARVDLRPVTKGRSDRWVRNAITWSAIRSQSAEGFDPAAVNAFERLCHLADRTSFQAPSGSVPLDVAGVEGATLWEILREMAAMGVELIAASDSRPVIVETSSASADIDIRVDNDGAIAVTAAVRHPELPSYGRLYALGDPPHSVVWQDHDGIHLAPARPPVSSAWTRLRELGGAIQIPSEGAEDFLSSVFPAVARAGWISSDNSFAPPPTPPPRPYLSVGSETQTGPAPRLHLRWGWLYHHGGGEEASVVPLVPRFGEYGRNLQAEAEWLDRVTATVEGDPYLLNAKTGSLIAELSLDGLVALNFLNAVVPVLEDLGVGVDVTSTVPHYLPAKEATVRVDVNENATSKDWLDLKVSVIADGYEVPLADLIEALSAGEEVLFLPEESLYLPLDNAEFATLKRLLEEARGLSDPRRATLQASAARVSWWEDLLSLGIVETSASRWFTSLRKALSATPVSVPLPEGLQADLRDYQVAGFQWLANLRRNGLGGILADDMGLGKTVQALAMIADEREEGAGSPSWLVVAPTSVVGNWAAEVSRFTPGLRVRVVESTGARRGVSLADLARDADIVVTSFALLRLEAEEYAALPWSGLVIDEAQNAKNHRAKVFSSLVKVGAPVTFAITGTPLENHLGEFWSMLTLVAPGLMGSVKQFTQTYRKPIEDGDTEMMALLRRRVAPFLLRRTKAGVALDLPEKQEQIYPVHLSPSHRRVYDQHLQRERQRVLGLLDDADHHQIEILAALTRLRQLAIDPGLVEEDTAAGSSKTEALLPLLEEATAEGHRVLVFSQFTRYLHKIAEELDRHGIRYSYLDGTTTHRQQVLDDFRNGENPVFLMSLKAGGVGINLTEVDYAILADPWWNPAVESQAIARAHRIGQTRPVHVYRLVAQGTIEEKMLALQQSKRELADNLLAGETGDGQVGGSRLSAEDVAALLE